jgi:hypothetical protein
VAYGDDARVTKVELLTDGELATDELASDELETDELATDEARVTMEVLPGSKLF